MTFSNTCTTVILVGCTVQCTNTSKSMKAMLMGLDDVIQSRGGLLLTSRSNRAVDLWPDRSLEREPHSSDCSRNGTLMTIILFCSAGKTAAKMGLSWFRWSRCYFWLGCCLPGWRKSYSSIAYAFHLRLSRHCCHAKAVSVFLVSLRDWQMGHHVS